MIKKITSLIIIVIMISTLFIGCDNVPTDTDDDGESIINFWGAHATEKILQDYDYTDSLKADAEINVIAAKGEYESSQIIMTAETDIKSYDISIGDLTITGGSEKFNKENILVYNLKYINVVTNYEANGAPTGMYPDALLPFNVAKAYKENKIEKGNNQGIYITFNVSVDQKEGVYTGNFIISYDGKNKTVPVRLEVIDLTVSEATNAKSIFLTQWSFESGELDSTQAMYNKYTDALIEYRLAPHILTSDTMHTDEDIAFYTELAYSYLSNPRCPNVVIPYNTVTVDGELCIDAAVFKKYIASFAQKSFETGLNMLEKSVCYFGIIDEPYPEIYNRVKVVSRVFKETVDEAADIIANDNTIVSAIKDDVVEAVRNLRNVVTSEYVSSLASDIDTWCPQFQYYDTDEKRAYYDDQEEKWWYGCIVPRVPYPTYHTEDTLISARAVGWMQAEYGIVGNLFWAVNNYAVYDGTKYNHLDDYYGTASRFPNVNGDGYLFYPGKQYGLNKPVATLRLEAIRDGIEEYEILREMKSRYQSLSAQHGFAFDFSTALSGMTSFIYSGTKVMSDSNMFDKARQSMLIRAKLADSDAGVCFIEQSDDNYGNITYKIFIKDGYTLEINGETPSLAQDLDGGTLYTSIFNLSEDSNSFTLSVIGGAKTDSYVIDLGGKAELKDAEDLNQSIIGQGVTPVVTEIDAETVDASLSGKILKLQLPATGNGSYQSFRMSDSLLSSVGADTSKIIIHLYYDSTFLYPTLDLVIAARYSKFNSNVDIEEYIIHDGLNAIEIPSSTLQVGRLGELQYLIFYIGDNAGEPARTIYIKDIIVYNK